MKRILLLMAFWTGLLSGLEADGEQERPLQERREQIRRACIAVVQASGHELAVATLISVLDLSKEEKEFLYSVDITVQKRLLSQGGDLASEQAMPDPSPYLHSSVFKEALIKTLWWGYLLRDGQLLSAVYRELAAAVESIGGEQEGYMNDATITLHALWRRVSPSVLAREHFAPDIAGCLFCHRGRLLIQLKEDFSIEDLEDAIIVQTVRAAERSLRRYLCDAVAKVLELHVLSIDEGNWCFPLPEKRTAVLNEFLVDFLKQLIKSHALDGQWIYLPSGDPKRAHHF